MDEAVDHFHAAFKNTADNTFLPPHVAFAEFSIGDEAREFRACAGAARLAVVSFTRTKHEILTIDAGQF